MKSDARVRRHASGNGISRGVKPADNARPTGAETGNRRANPVIYADERNLRLKRRPHERVKLPETLSPKWYRDGPNTCERYVGLCQWSRGVEKAAKDHENESKRKTGNSHTAMPERDARMPACGGEGGGG